MKIRPQLGLRSLRNFWLGGRESAGRRDKTEQPIFLR